MIRATRLPLGAAMLLAACGTPPALRQSPLPQGFNAARYAGDGANAAQLAQWWRGFDDPLLAQVVAEALERNLDVQLALTRIRTARAQLRQTRRALLPVLDVPGQASRQWIDTEPLDFPGASELGFDGDTIRFDQWQLALQASWEPDIFGANRTRAAAADRQVAAAEAQAVAARIAVASNAAQAYLQMRGLLAQRALIEDSVVLARESERAASGLFRIGTATQLDVASARAERLRIEARRDEVEAGLAEAGYALDTLTDRPPGTARATLGTATRIPRVAARIPVGQPVDLLRRRPDVIAATAGLAAAELQALASRRDLFPTIGLSAFAGRTGIAIGNLSTASNLASVAAQLSFPWLSPAMRAQVGIADAQIDTGFVELRQAIATAIQEVETATAQAGYRERQRTALARARAAADERLRMARRSFEVGVVDLQPVLEAQQALLQVREAQLQTDQALALAQVVLFTALGGGWRRPETAVDDVQAVRDALAADPIGNRVRAKDRNEAPGAAGSEIFDPGF